MMERRAFITGAISALAVPLAAGAQQPGKVYRLGILRSDSGPPAGGREAFRAAMRERGWIDGENIAYEGRYAEGRYERLPDLAAELVRLKADVILVVGNSAARAVSQATRTIPIVMAFVSNPVGDGLVASLARPGGNITGLSDDVSPDIVGKQLQILKEVVPGASRVAALSRTWTDDAHRKAYTEAFERAARTLGVQLQSVRVHGPADFDGAFAAMAAERAQALWVADWSLFRVHLRRLLDLVARSRLPAMYQHRDWATAGGLMAYGVNDRELPRRLAAYLDRVLRGARPADLPVEQPTAFELVVNLKTAKALGLTVAPSLLARADQVIE